MVQYEPVACPIGGSVTVPQGDARALANMPWPGAAADQKNAGRSAMTIAEAGVQADAYPRRVMPVTTHARPRALQNKPTMMRTKACCSPALWVFTRSAAATPSCTE
jgi:hypothetical protein